MISERELIKKILRISSVSKKDPALVSGIGDDCAIIAPDPSRHLAVTTDTMVETVHFDLSYFAPWHLGRKLASVNLSDLAAASARPRWAFLNIAMRPGLSEDFWDVFFSGLCSRLDEYGAFLAGGDTVSSPKHLTLTLTLVGDVDKEKRLTRNSASPGDLVFCSGFLGEAACGLLWLMKMKEKGIKGLNCLSSSGLPDQSVGKVVRRHLDPEPRLKLSSALAASGFVKAGIDISDGLSTDLSHICEESKAGAAIYPDAIPISEETQAVARLLSQNPINLALSGGEDYELLWTAPERFKDQVISIASEAMGCPPNIIGKIVAGKGVFLKDGEEMRDVSFKGYEHKCST